MTKDIGIEFDVAPFLNGIEQDLDHLVKESRKGIDEIAHEMASDMKRKAHDREVAASIAVTVTAKYTDVGTNHFRAIWEEFGTGLFNPKRRRPIVAKAGRKLLGGGLEHPVLSVAGIHPHPFFRPAFALAAKKLKAVIDG
jgi:hypothetical protein